MRTIDEELARTGGDIREAADRRRLPPLQKPPHRTVLRLAAAAVAAVALVAAFGIPAWVGTSDSLQGEAASTPPDSFGTWETMAQAPIPPRPHAVSAWTGTEALFWAGSSLSRGFAYADGAAYDPLTDTWRNIPVPGWGHPGLSGVFAGGELYALAKGGGTRFNPADGTWANLPPVEGMFLAATVATGERVWGLGPASLNPVGQTDVAIARFDPQENDWIYGPVFEGTPDTGSLFQDVFFSDQPALWTGSEIVIWNAEGGGAAFSPITETWEQIPAPKTESGILVTSKATVASAELVVIAEVSSDSEGNIALARYREATWTWQDLDIHMADLDEATVAAAGDWILLFAPEQDPIIIHVPSGAWTQVSGPIAGLQAPNTVWTGDRLVVWGGVSSPTESTPSPANGAIWTPPRG